MPDGAATVTIPGVEIVKAGRWAASTGPVDVSVEDIADAVAAAADPEVDKGPLKFGHTGALSDLGDSTPAFGWLDNLRASDDGQTVIGDLVDIPIALAPAVKAAFKRRSAELAWGVKTVGGRTYRMVIDGLALLGVQPPAVKGMADLAALYDPAAPPVTLATSKLSATSHSTLSFDDDQVHIVFNGRVQTADELLTAIRADLDSRGLLSGAPHAVPVRTTPNGGTMPKYKPETIKKLRSLLSDVTDDTPDEDVEAKAEEAGITPDGEAADGADDTGNDDGVGDDKPPSELAAAAAAATAAGMVLIPKDLLTQIGEQAKAGAEARTLLAAQARDDVLDQAYRAGKLGAGDTAVKVRAQLAAALDKDPDGTRALIDALPQIVPVGELGTADTGANHSDLSAQADEAAWAAWDRQVFGDELPTPAKEA